MQSGLSMCVPLALPHVTYQAAGITSGWNHNRNIWKAIAWKHIRCHNWYPNVKIRIDALVTIGTQMSRFGSIHLQHWYPKVNMRIDPFATLVPQCQYSDRSICNIGTQMSIFGSIHLQHWYPTVNIRIDPFATLVPKLPNSKLYIWSPQPCLLRGVDLDSQTYPGWPQILCISNIFEIFVRVATNPGFSKDQALARDARCQWYTILAVMAGGPGRMDGQESPLPHSW